MFPVSMFPTVSGGGGGVDPAQLAAYALKTDVTTQLTPYALKTELPDISGLESRLTLALASASEFVVYPWLPPPHTKPELLFTIWAETGYGDNPMLNLINPNSPPAENDSTTVLYRWRDVIRWYFTGSFDPSTIDVVGYGNTQYLPPGPQQPGGIRMLRGINAPVARCRMQRTMPPAWAGVWIVSLQSPLSSGARSWWNIRSNYLILRTRLDAALGYGIDMFQYVPETGASGGVGWFRSELFKNEFVENKPIVIGVSVDLTNNRLVLAGNQRVYTGHGSTTAKVQTHSRTGGVTAPVTLTDIVDNTVPSSLNWTDIGNGIWLGDNDATATSSPMDVGWSTTDPMIWTFEVGGLAALTGTNTNSTRDMTLHTCALYDRFLDTEELMQECYFHTDMTLRRTVPATYVQ